MIDEDLIFQQSGKRIKLSNNRNISWIFFYSIFLIGVFYFIFLQVFLKKDLILAETNMKYLTYFSFPPRGIIYDRFGEILAMSENSFDVYIDLSKYQNEKFFLDGNFFYRGNQLIIRNVNREKALDLIIKEKQSNYLKVIPSYHRRYLAGESIGNLIGFVGFPTKNQSQFHPEEFIGKSGLELVYQEYLRGRPGEIVYQRGYNNTLKKIREIQPLAGSNLILTINGQFQQKAYELIKDYFQEHNYQKGAFIALDPNSGEIISLISFPSYDPNWLLDKKKALLVLNNSNQPLFNRAISGLYSPGSTIKPLVAIGALEEKIVSPETKIYSSGELKIPNPYLPGRYSVFKDNKVHGWTDIRKAIADSVNIYFYVVAGGYPYPSDEIPIKNGLGISRLFRYWQLFNLGQRTGIDLNGEEEGFLPSPEKKSLNLTDKVWRLGDTYNVAIGQGDILVTPLQIALWTSALATNRIYQPFLVKKIVNNNGQVIFTRQPIIKKDKLVNPENLKIIQEGMRQTVTNGTAKMLNDLEVKVAGKSGTPEIFGKKKLNAIFTGYFPYEKPEIVMTLLIENVPIGSVATLPLYKELVKTYLDLKKLKN
ncbi:MAG: penicillin-binding protein 2 [Candidatus Parcubacteria bacterium]|nr:MAG: penicillin-binding protein 2 [Candidatus Parcubacteria bacterium]